MNRKLRGNKIGSQRVWSHIW